MKKTMKLFWLIAATAIVFSCSKESQDVTPTPTKPVEEDNTTTVIPAVDGNVLTSFGVTFEGNPVDPESKVTVNLSTGETDLEVDDEVLVFVDEDNKAIYKYNGEVFELKDGETEVVLSSPASVFYPADRFEKATGLFVMPSGIEATGDFGAINPMAGVITNGTGNYTVELCNIASVLRVQVTADVDINSVKLDYGSAICYAAGSKFTVNASEKTMSYAFVASDNTYDTVELATHAHSADVLFIIPTVGLPSGLTVTANLDEPHNGGANTFTVANESTLARERNKISKMSFKAKLFDGGNGTSENPYLINSAKDFKYIQKYTANGYAPGNKDAAHFLSAYYQQTADINFNNTSITPIGGNASRFSGQYDGNNKSLQNIKIEVDGQFAAPFAYLVGDAEIKNLTVSGSITKTETTTNSLAGSIAGILNGNAKVTGCTSSATILSTATYTGGIAGRLYSSTAGISGCVNNGEVSGSGNVGGIVGQINNGTVSSCDNTGKVAASGDRVGGIAGHLNNASASISKCNNTGEVNGRVSSGNAAHAGGIVGQISNGKVDNCINRADVSAVNNVGTASSEVGGITGKISGGTISACYSATAKTISGASRVGGIAGYQTNNSSSGSLIINCAAKSNIKTVGTGNNGAGGGLVGQMDSSNEQDVILTNSVAFASGIYNTVSSNSYLGGIVGYVKGTQKYCYVRNCYSCHNNVNGNAGIYFGTSWNSSNTKKTYMGGVYGYLEKGTVQNCYCVGPDGKNGNGISTDALAGAGKKSATTADITAANTRMVMNTVKNGTGTVDPHDWTIAFSGIKPYDITEAYLVDVMNLGTYASVIGGDLISYTIYTGTIEAVCAWDIISDANLFAIPSVLKEGFVF